MPENLSAEQFVEELGAHRLQEQREKYQRYFKTGEGQYGEGDMFIGVRMGQVFALAKEFVDMPPDEGRRKELFDLYLRRTDRINNWDLVDLGAPYVVGRYLFDKPRDVLYELARSESVWERRTAIVATSYFIRQATWTTRSRSPRCCSMMTTS